MLLQLFNNELKEMPIISSNLKNSILAQGWSKKKTRQAIEIVKQLQKRNLIETVNVLGTSYVKLSKLTITLSPSECGIRDSKIYGKNNIRKANNYIERLLNDINNISEKVRFSLAGHFYDKEVCEFSIDWQF